MHEIKTVLSSFLHCSLKCCYIYLIIHPSNSFVEMNTDSLSLSKQQFDLWIGITTYRTVLPQKLTGPQLVNKFPAFYGTAFIRDRHLSLSGARSIQSTAPSHFMKIHFNIIFPSRPRTSRWSLPLRSPLLPQTLYAPLPLIHATFPANFTNLDLIIRIVFGEIRSSISIISDRFLGGQMLFLWRNSPTWA